MSTSSYPKLPRSTINRYKPRGKYDFATIHSIVNSVPVVHVSFTTPDPADPFPATIPMIGFMASFENLAAGEDDALDLYLHGYISSRLMRLGGSSSSQGNGNSNNSVEEEEEEGFPVTVAATHVDGLVLALTPNSHSYNYHSAILHGYASKVTEVDEKIWAMERITNGVLADRWENTRVPPNKTEMTSTQILKVRIVSASAKIRAGTAHDDRVDTKNDDVRARTWIGVVPTWTAYGEPIASPENRVQKVPEHIRKYVERENAAGAKLAREAAEE